ncbi:tyrosine-type recombinase/integrase [Gryllotalpicola reticulitermitis]|uniref:Tyrosine-type recombinase/integrase n=1 Tax=Gryllotalpicola reticulitermitis TaxID=1184153 RepID=A0ABV8Q9U1_9MICO
MMADVYRRCACRKPDGKQFGVLPSKPTERQLAATCPQLISDSRHGSWSFYVRDSNTGTQYRKGGFKTRSEAVKARNELAGKLDKGTYKPPSKILYGDYLEAWFKRRQTTGKTFKATTVNNYSRYLANDLKPSALARMPISEIRRMHVQAFVDQLIADGRGATTIRRIVAVVQGSLRAAGKDNLNDHAPGVGLDLPQAERKEMEVWEPAQVGKFLDTAAQHRLGALFELAIFTGMRRGELLGLRWEDVNFADRSIQVRHNRTQAGHVIEETTPKTRSGRRTVELADNTSAALVAWKLTQEAEAKNWRESGAWHDTGYVFTYEDGTPLKPQYVTRLFDKLRLKARLPKMTFHGQRHEAASLMIASGEDLAIVSKVLGHSSYSITSDMYTHLVASAARNAAEKAAALVPRQAADLHIS